MKLLIQHTLYGASRRCSQTVIELWLEADPGDREALVVHGHVLRQKVVEVLGEASLRPAPGHPLLGSLTDSPAENYARLVGGVALALQQHAGHRVGFFGLYPQAEENRCCVAIEYEDGHSAGGACNLALHLLAELEPRIALANMPIADYAGFAAGLERFMAEAPDRVLPRDAQAIIDAAARLDVPCVKLDRDPYQGVAGNFRIRLHGMLKLGHACHQRVIDGTFPIDSDGALAALVHDREAVVKALATLGLPSVARDPGGSVCVSARHAVRAAERVGYPVVVKARSIPRGRRVANAGAEPLTGPEQVRAAAERLLCTSRGVFVEAWAAGRAFKAIVANREVVAVIELQDGIAVADVTAETHPTVLESARHAAGRLQSGLMTLSIVCQDIGRPLRENAAVVGLDVAPALDTFLPEAAPFPASGILDRAMEGLVRFLFPAGTKSRIPLVAVTGTNGKTTTSALIERAAVAAGFATGRVGTTGWYLRGQLQEYGDMSGGAYHHRLLESPELQFGVLETARGAVLTQGMMFDGCDVAVCTNVTADHLGRYGIDSVEQMAVIKEHIVKRARDAVVLNADNPHTAAMATRMEGRRVWMTSTEQTLDALRQRFGPEPFYCLAAAGDGAEWIEYSVENERRRLMPVRDIPITFDGLLRFNVSNAIQAAAACLQMGLPEQAIRNALADFTPRFEDSPGRMNFYHGLPFTVLYDYVHNEAGHRQLARFLRSREVPGRRILHFSASASWTDDAIASLSRAVAGCYDLYLCRGYPKLFDRQPGEVGALLARGLREAGVPDSAIMELHGDDTLEQGLRLCRPGDLLVFVCSTIRLAEEWVTITGWRESAG